MGALRPWHIIVLLVVVLLLFGAKRLPDLARSVGKSLRIFKDEMSQLTDEDKARGDAAESGTSPQSGTNPAGPAASGPTAPGSGPGGDEPRPPTDYPTHR